MYTRGLLLVLAVCSCSAANALYDPPGDEGGSTAGTGESNASATTTTTPASTTLGQDGDGTSEAETQGEVDDDPTDCPPHPWYPDEDQDGFGDPDGEVLACDPPTEDHVDNGDDCDDESPAVNPEADEQCNEIDDDCDGLVDEGSDTNVDCTGCQFVPAIDGLRWFAVCTGPATWAEGPAWCQDSFGPEAQLAIIEDPDDQAKLLPLVVEDTWIGMSDLEQTDVWRWHDGSTNLELGQQLGYDGWGATQPDPGGDEHCVEIDPRQSGWADSPCNQPQPIICEYPQ